MTSVRCTVKDKERTTTVQLGILFPMKSYRCLPNIVPKPNMDDLVSCFVLLLVLFPPSKISTKYQHQELHKHHSHIISLPTAKTSHQHNEHLSPTLLHPKTSPDKHQPPSPIMFPHSSNLCIALALILGAHAAPTLNTTQPLLTRDSNAFTMSDLTITMFDQPGCQGGEWPLLIQYGLNNHFTVRSYTLSRGLRGEQLDFSTFNVSRGFTPGLRFDMIYIVVAVVRIFFGVSPSLMDALVFLWPLEGILLTGGLGVGSKVGRTGWD